MKIKVGIIGFGLIGKKRLNALKQISNVIAVSDVNESMLQSKELDKLIHSIILYDNLSKNEILN